MTYWTGQNPLPEPTCARTPTLQMLPSFCRRASLLWVTLLRQEVGLGDPQRSLPTPNILWFCQALGHPREARVGGTPEGNRRKPRWGEKICSRVDCVTVLGLAGKSSPGKRRSLGQRFSRLVFDSGPGRRFGCRPKRQEVFLHYVIL